MLQPSKPAEKQKHGQGSATTVSEISGEMVQGSAYSDSNPKLLRDSAQIEPSSHLAATITTTKTPRSAQVLHQLRPDPRGEAVKYTTVKKQGETLVLIDTLQFLHRSR